MALQTAADGSWAVYIGAVNNAWMTKEAEFVRRANQAGFLALVMTIIASFLSVGRMFRSCVSCGRIVGSQDRGLLLKKLLLMIILAVLLGWRKAGYTIENCRGDFVSRDLIAPQDQQAKSADK